MTIKEKQEEIKRVSREKQRYFYNLVDRNFLNSEVKKTNTNYKIAILISGGLRNFVTTQPWINKFLIEPLNADVFVNGWESKDGFDNDIKNIINYHNLKSYNIQDRLKTNIPIPNSMHGKYPRHVSEGWGMEVADHILGQLYNIKKCYSLIEEYEIKNNFIYDIIIRIRPDEFWFDKLQDSDLDYIYNNRCLATPQHYLSVIGGNLINDRFAMGNREVMKEYCSMFDYVNQYSQYAGNDEATEFYTNYHITQTMKINVHNIDITFMLEYPVDYDMEPGFNPTTIRHLNQNDSNVAIHVATLIKNNKK